MQVIVSVRRKGTEWRGALIVDNRVEDALVGENVAEMIVDALAPTFLPAYPDGQQIEVIVNVQPTQWRQSGQAEAVR